MGEANRRAIAQGFDDAEHRRLQLNVERLHKERVARGWNAFQANVETVYGKASDLIERQKEIFDARSLVFFNGDLHLIKDGKSEVISTKYVEPPLAGGNEFVVYDEAHLIEDELAIRLSSSYTASEEYAKEIAASGNGMLIVEEMTKAEFEARYPSTIEPLTTRKICAGEYEVTRNRDGAKYRISTLSKGKWDMLPMNSVEPVTSHPTLAAAKAAIPA